MATSLAKLADNLAEEILKLNANMDTIIKNVVRVELNTKIVSAVLNTQMLKMIYTNVYVAIG